MPKFGAIRALVPGLAARRASDLVEAGGVEAGRADDRVDAPFDTPAEVAHHHVGVGEVDHHVGGGDRVEGVVLVDGSHELQVVGRVDGLAHLIPDAAARAQHTYFDHVPRLARPVGQLTAEEKSLPAKGPDHGQGEGAGQHVGGDLGDVGGRHGVDALEDLVDGHEAGRRRARSCRSASCGSRCPPGPSTRPPRIWPLPRTISSSVKPSETTRAISSRQILRTSSILAGRHPTYTPNWPVSAYCEV